MRRRASVALMGFVLALMAVVLAGATTVALAKKHRTPRRAASLRPGPAVLYRKPAIAAQLTNRRPWRARPILVSGATAYRRGEFLYQDFLYDDHGAHEVPDPTDPRAANGGDLFSKPNGTYTYPTAARYANNAADLVEFRVKPLSRKTAFRITLNTLGNPSLIAFSIAIGGRTGHTFPFPGGANVVAPARFFLTVHPAKRKLVADLVHAGSGKRVKGPRARVKVDRSRRQIVIEISHRVWNPHRRTVRLAMGVGLWDAAHKAYLPPRAVADATHPGGAGTAAHPAAFFNVAFRTREPFPSPTEGSRAVLNAAWWRDREQGAALAAGNISPFFAEVSFAKLARNVRDNSRIPRTGPMDRILASHFAPGRGADYASECGLNGTAKPASCGPEYRGRLQSYAIYVPRTARPAAGYGLTLLLHSLSANYNQYLGTRNQSEFGDRATPSIVITPEARGPDLFYQGLGAADTFEVWADVAHRYRLDSAHADITGYSMGGFGTFILGEQFPDLFARAQPTVGAEFDTDNLASLRNLPILMWNNSADELVPPASFGPDAARLSSLRYRYELDTYEPCAASPMPVRCSPLFANHLELAVNDQFAPAAAFLGSARVERNPAHITYVVDAARDRRGLGIVGDHAYWVSGLRLRSSAQTSTTGDPDGQIDAVAHGFGAGDPAPGAPQIGIGSLPGGNLGTLRFARTARTWGPSAPASRGDAIDITATNIAGASIDVARAHVDCKVALHITSDGPLTVKLRGCRRLVRAG